MASDKERALCKAKRRFSSDADAQAAVKRINPSRALKKPARVYRCTVCVGYHLTSRR